jgi:hypothetical protein
VSKKATVLLIGIICCSLLIAASIAGAAPIKATSVEFSMNFDGKRMKLPEGQHVFVVKGTSYVPIRFIAYALQKSVVWDNATATVSVSEPSKQEQVMLEEYLLNLTIDAGDKSTAGGVAITPVPKAVNFIFNKEKKMLPPGQSGYVVDGALYVPVRFMAESIGTVIHWDPVAKQVSGRSEAYIEVEQAAAESKQEDKKSDSGKEADAGTGVIPPGGAPIFVGGGAKPSKQSIEAAAETKLTALKSSCESSLMNIGMSYVGTTDSALKQELIAQGQAALNGCTTNFNSILSDTEAQLLANGYTTEALATYRAEFEEQVAAGRTIMEELAK